MNETTTYGIVTLECTCGACPEQYDAFIDGEALGYLRLRHGCFRAEYRNKIVYEASPQGDGIFESDEREKYLTAACQAISNAHLGVNAAEPDSELLRLREVVQKQAERIKELEWRLDGLDR